MRIISGKYKGRVFNAKLPAGVRPTQDAMRETIFNILNNYIDFKGKTVADICAGSGMFGLEALSRGAKFVHFVDKNRQSLEYIQNSLNNINAEKQSYKIYNLDAVQFINHFSSNAFSPTVTEVQRNLLDLIFLDPPYNTNIVNDVLHYASENNLTELKILNSDGIIIAETALHNEVLVPEEFVVLTVRQFGASKVTMISLQ